MNSIKHQATKITHKFQLHSFTLTVKSLKRKLREQLSTTGSGKSGQLSVTPMDCSTPGFPVHHHLLQLAQTHVHRVSDAIQPIILCHPFLLPPSTFPSIRVFSSESLLRIRWPKYWSFILTMIAVIIYSHITHERIVHVSEE